LGKDIQLSELSSTGAQPSQPGGVLLIRSRKANHQGKAMLADESAVVQRAKSDPEAFGLLYECYVSTIYNYIYYRVGNQHDAEDLTARTFHRALNHIGRYVDRGAPFSAWLYRIAHNLVANWHRDQSRRKIISLEDIKLSVQRRKGPDQVAEQQEEKDQLLAVIRRLPSDRQQLLILKFVEGMSNAEIGELMGRSEGAIKSLYHRTLLSLREMFDAQQRS
jgi:RNA polymerase sigma-70 factor (ECF subfamily)